MIRVETQSEIATSSELARVLVYENDNLVAEVTAQIKPQQGGDGGFYPCVLLTSKKMG